MKWFISAPTNIKFNKISDGVGYALVKLTIPDSQAPCQQLFNIEVKCGTWTARDFFNIDVIKKGFI
jgi:hypothetical protein